MEPDPENPNSHPRKPLGTALCVAFAPAGLSLVLSLACRFFPQQPPNLFLTLFLALGILGFVTSLFAGIRLSPDSRLGGVLLGLGLWFVNLAVSVFGCGLISR
jgi:hypothetical protein